MSDQQRTTSAREAPACVFCARGLAPADCIVSIRVPSHTLGQKYFGAHARCLREAFPPDSVRLIDLDDVPPGLDHFLALRA